MMKSPQLSEFLPLILIALILICLGLIYLYFSAARQLSSSRERNLQLQGEIDSRARDIHEQWRRCDVDAVRIEQKGIAIREAATQLEQWRIENELTIRQDAIQRSQSVIVGRVTEHLIPFMPAFPYNPKDARFIGSPVDLIVFDGLDEGNLREVIFLEVKTGGSSLTPRQRQIRDALSEARVQWRELRVD